MEWLMNWWWATVLGPLVLAAVIIYALLNRRRLSRGEKLGQDRAINELYDDPEGRSSPQGAARKRQSER